MAAVERLADPEALKAVADKAKAARPRAAPARGSRPASRRLAAAPPPPPPSTTTRPSGAPTRRPAPRTSARPRARAGRGPRRPRGGHRGAEGEAIPQALEHAREEWAGLAPLAGPIARRSTAGSRRPRGGRERHAAYLAGLARREELQALVSRRRRSAARSSAPPAPPSRRSRRSGARPRPAPTCPTCGRGSRPSPPPCARAAARPATSRPQKDQQHLEPALRLADRAEALVAAGRRGVPARRRPRAARDPRGPRAPRALPHPQGPRRGPRPARGGAQAPLPAPAAAARGRGVEALGQRHRAGGAVREGRGAPRGGGPRACRERRCASSTPAGSRPRRPRRTRRRRCGRASRPRATRSSRAADAFFAKQAEELAGNLKKKEALCERAEALAESTDWLKTAEELRKLQAEWKAIGPVPRAVSQRVWERFRKPCDHFFTRWQEHRNQRSHEWARQPREEGGPVREGRGAPRSPPTGRPARPSSSGCRPSGARSAP